MALWKKLIYSSSRAELLDVTASYFKGDGSALTNIIASSASYAATSSYYSNDIKSVGITVDGGGSVITTGIKGDATVPFNGTITAWYLTSDQVGSVVFDVWKDTFGNYPPTVLDTITGTEKPSLVAASSNSDTNLTTWSTNIVSGDVLRFNVDSVSTLTRATLTLKILKT